MNKPRLFPIRSAGNSYCCPAVISRLTGVTTGEAATLIRQRTGQTRVRGTSIMATNKVLASLGVELVRTPSGMTLEAFPHLEGTFVAYTMHHALIVHDGMAVCTLTRHKLVPLMYHPNSADKLTNVYRVMRQEIDLAPIRAIEEAKRRRELDHIIEKNVRMMARRFDIDVSVELRGEDDITIWVYPPDTMADDPYDDDHYVYTWADALTRVQEYLTILAKGV